MIVAKQIVPWPAKFQNGLNKCGPVNYVMNDFPSDAQSGLLTCRINLAKVEYCDLTNFFFKFSFNFSVSGWIINSKVNQVKV